MIAGAVFALEVFALAAVILALPVRVTRQEERRLRERDR
mgnify:CR=1 FL=1